MDADESKASAGTFIYFWADIKPVRTLSVCEGVESMEKNPKKSRRKFVENCVIKEKKEKDSRLSEKRKFFMSALQFH